MSSRVSFSGVMARLLRVVVVLALVMLGVAMPQGTARAGLHEMHGTSGAMAEMPMGHVMTEHGALPSGTAHSGHSLACAIACVGGAIPAAGPIAPMTFQVMATVWVIEGWAMPMGSTPAPAARPPRIL